MRIKSESLVLDEQVRPVTETGLITRTGLNGQETGPTAESGENCNSAVNADQKVEAKVQDWRMPIIAYLKDPNCGAE